MNVFKMLVFAIAAIALIYVFYSLLPYFFPGKDAFALLSNNLNGAQLNEGKSIFLDITFKEKEGLAAQNFDAANRSIAFECNNPKICCNINENCGLIEWDERRILFNSAKTILTASRCSFSGNMYACRIYFGEAPAQLAFKKTEIKKTIDLSSEPAEISIEIENSGKQEMLFGSLKIDVFQKFFEGGVWQKKFFTGASKVIPLNRLLGGEKTKMQVPLELFEGSFEISLVAFGENSGSDQNKIAVEVSGTENCIAENCDYPELDSGGECRTTCYCQKCMLVDSCDKAIKAKTPEELGLPAGVSLNGLEAIINCQGCGSNKIEFVLKNENCN
ncbi:MAG: hypothetical protein PHD95_03760 [Candidatus ainarchaeum sp.]|nr:hypothetical protein [Candidatus ainarchaeum sp.]